MNKYVLACVAAMMMPMAVLAQDFADYHYLPPESAEGEKAAPEESMGAEALSAIIECAHPIQVFRGFEGQKSALEAGGTDYPALRVAAEYAVDWDGDILFDDGFEKGGNRYYVAEALSLEASAVRLCVDMRALAADAEVWVVAPAIPRAFGPYRAADASSDRFWLPTISGDTALLAVRQVSGGRPALRIGSLAHFYADMEKTAYPCPIPAACVENDTFQKVSTGVGRLLIPIRNEGMFLCSGALLNVPDTAQPEPLMLSAHHCFDGDVEVTGVEVFWDYRAANCDGSGVPDLDSEAVPRSRGVSILAEDACLDGEFFQLDAVPNGTLGRAWLGWDARTPSVGDYAAGAHYPGGAAMKTCLGTIQAVDIRACLDMLCLSPVFHQTRVQWASGITEGGSSGSPVMYRNINYRVFGMLSNGPVHDCDNPPQNLDDFASFARFYPEIQCYLRPGTECGAAQTCDSGLCVAKALFGEGSRTVENIRVFRDKVLMPTAVGRALASAYYEHAPEMLRAMRLNTQLRGYFAAAAVPAATLGAWLK